MLENIGKNRIKNENTIFDKYYFQLNHKASKQKLTFGIFNETLEQRHLLENFERKVKASLFFIYLILFLVFIVEILVNEYNLNCTSTKSHGTYVNQKVLTNFYLNCTNIIIQLAIFYDRHDFIWIGADETLELNFNLSFGDFPRALNK